MASNVLRLKNNVPASWTTAAQPSRRPCEGSARPARHCRVAAVVKNSDPAKNVTESASVPTRSTNDGAAPAAKQAEPTANRMAIHLVIRHSVGAGPLAGILRRG